MAAVREAEAEAIARALSVTGGNKLKAANLLGVSYKTLLSKVKEYKLSAQSEGAQASKET
jgi:DNA-binding NtrC family response regulator